MSQQIKFTIKKGGTVVAEGVNCTGEICRTLSAPIEAALGQTQTTLDKPEAFVELEIQTVNETEDQ